MVCTMLNKKIKAENMVYAIAVTAEQKTAVGKFSFESLLYLSLKKFMKNIAPTRFGKEMIAVPMANNGLNARSYKAAKTIERAIQIEEKPMIMMPISIGMKKQHLSSSSSILTSYIKESPFEEYFWNLSLS